MTRSSRMIARTAVCAAAVLAAATASAQTSPTAEVGVIMSISAVSVEDGDGGVLSGFGVDVAGTAKSTGYVSYSRWDRPGDPSRGITGAVMFRGGWRVQGHSRRVRPFFDLGGAIGEADYVRPNTAAWSHSYFGVDVGGGATIAIGNRAYMRPQARAQWLIYGGAISAGIGVGIRF